VHAFVHGCAGDFSNTGTRKEIKQFNKWLGKLPHAHKIVIAGNHDTTMDDAYYKRKGCWRFHRGENQGESQGAACSRMRRVSCACKQLSPHQTARVFGRV